MTKEALCISSFDQSVQKEPLTRNNNRSALIASHQVQRAKETVSVAYSYSYNHNETATCKRQNGIEAAAHKLPELSNTGSHVPWHSRVHEQHVLQKILELAKAEKNVTT